MLTPTTSSFCSNHAILALLLATTLTACGQRDFALQRARAKEKWATERSAFDAPLASPATPRREYAAIPPDSPTRVDFRLDREVLVAADPRRPETLLGRTGGLEVDNHNNVYVLDRSTGTVKVFGPTGQYLHSIGEGIGQGPGQLGRTGRLALGGEEVFYVSGADRRLVRWRLDGEHLRTAAVRHMIHMVRATPDGVLLASWRSTPEFPYTFQIGHLLGGGGVIPLLGRARYPRPVVFRGARGHFINEIPSPVNQFAVGANRLYVTTSQRYEVLAFSLTPPGEAWVLGVDHPAAAFTDSDRASVLATEREDIPDVVEEEIDWPAHYPSLDTQAALRVDGRGRLFVFPFVKDREIGSRYPVDVYDQDGNRIAVGTMPHINWAATMDDFIYALERGADEEFEIVRYRLILSQANEAG